MTDSAKWVWVADKKDVFVKGKIVEEDGDNFSVKIPETGETRVVQSSQMEKVNPAQFSNVGDMAELTYLNEPSVIANLKTRWFAGDIYTYSGLFLVAVNPYRPLEIYGDQTVAKFKGKRRDEADPHIFAIAEEAYRSMLETKCDQSILITGESGAGKTENTKKTIQYLSSVTKSNSKGGIDARLIQTNPILEAFGNAQTVRNSNSSRFGKFIKIRFASQSNYITGASIQWYLLEKSRVVSQHVNERNYHIFYQLLSGAPSDLKKKLLLPDGASPKDFTYLKSSSPTIKGVNDAELYGKLLEAFYIMGFSQKDIEKVMEIVAAVLLLGEIKYKASSVDQGSVCDMEDVERVAQLLGLDPDRLINSILQPKVKVGRELTTQSRTSAQAQHTTNALAKSLYERLFGYIVDQLNLRLGTETDFSCSIGVLDIAGFEIFEHNSFEQLCINYTNEKLQQFFNHHMFVLEQQEYVKENVDWEYVDYGSDLQPTIDLIEQSTNPMGIFSCLNEESILPSGSDTAFKEKLVKNWDGNNPKFTPSRLGEGFTIAHYAQSVEYQTDGWMEKNKDPLSDAVEFEMSESSHTLIRTLFPSNTSKVGKASILRTVAQRHKEQLNSLMTHLRATQPHFVRCIIANTERSATTFDNHLVLDQLRYNGVLEGIRIARTGFPNRLEFEEFSERYRILVGTVSGPADSQQKCATILQKINLDPSQYKVGLSKVFFRNGVLAKLENKLDILVAEQALLIQTFARGALVRIAVRRKFHRRRAAKVIATCFKLSQNYSKDPWWQFNIGLKPLLMSKESMENNKKDLRMQKLETTLHRLKEEQVELISSKNELRGELISALKAKEVLAKSLECSKLEQKERDETHKTAILAARSRDEASAAALRELTDRHSAMHREFEVFKGAKAELEKNLKASFQAQWEDGQNNLREEVKRITDAEKAFADAKIELENKALQDRELTKKLVDENKRLTEELKVAKAKVLSLTSEYSQLSESSHALQKDTDARLMESTKRLTSLEKELEALSNSKISEQKELEDLKTRLENSNKKVESLSSSLAFKNTDVAKAKEDLEATQKKLNSSVEELKKLRDWLSKAKAELQVAVESRRELAELQDTHKRFSEEAAVEKRDLLKKLNEAVTGFTVMKEKAASSLDPKQFQTLQHEKDKAARALDNATENLLKTNEELNKAREKTKALEMDLQSTKDALSESKSLQTSLSQRLEASEKDKKAIEAKLDELRLSKESLASDFALATKSQSETTAQLDSMRKRLQTSDKRLADAQAKLANVSKSGSHAHLCSPAANLNGIIRPSEVQKGAPSSQIAYSRSRIQAKSLSSVLTQKNCSQKEDVEHELALAKHDLKQAEAQMENLKAELESSRKEVAQAAILRQKYEKLQRDKAMLVRDKSHLMLGVQKNRGQTRELELAKAQASEVKRLQSEIKVLNLKLVRSERDRKALESKTSISNEMTSSDNDSLESLRHRLRLAELSKLQLSKTVHELGKAQAAESANLSIWPAEVDAAHGLTGTNQGESEALRNISNDRKVSDHTFLAAEHVKTADLEEALEIYKSRASEFHLKLEKAELVVKSATRAEKIAKQQAEDYKRRLELAQNEHGSEVNELCRENLKSKQEIDSRDSKVENFLVQANLGGDLKNQMKSMNSTLRELGIERDRLAKDKARLEKRLHDMVSSFDHHPRQLQEQILSLKQNEQHMMREQGELRWKLERKGRLVDQLRRSMTDAEARIDQCRAEIDRLHSNAEAREIALRQANREISDVNEKRLIAERELEQYRLPRSKTSASQASRESRPAFV